MTILTPTFTELAKGAATAQPLAPRSDGGTPPVHIVQSHEPLQSEAMLPLASPVENKTETPPVAPVAEPAPLKIALIGTAPSSRHLAPYHDPSWTIWACSPGNQNMIPRVDAWFELHGNLHWPENAHYGKPYVEWLARLTIPLYMQNQQYVTNAVSFPYEEMVKEFGRDFFTSSFAWMMAFAITKGAKEIALFGIDMASRDEYILQRPGFYFFKHVAEQRGIKVWAPNESDIMQPPGLYGFSEVRPFGRKLLARKQELKDRINGMIAERDKLNHNITYLQGALEDLDYIESIWIGQG
jgi:hypothetical protein